MKPSKAERRIEQKAFERKQNFKDNLNYSILIGFAILFVVVYWFKPLSIGYDIRHTIFVYILPIVVGTALLFIYRKRFINADAVKAVTKFHHKVGYTIVILFYSALLSYITLGSVTNIIWESANYYSAKTDRQHTIILPVDEFHKGSGAKAKHSIRFHFHGEKEYIKVSSDYIRQCMAQSATKHHLKLKIREGLWNHYLVDDWDIIK